MASQDVNMGSQELEHSPKQEKASLLDNPYLLGVALVNTLLITHYIVQNIDENIVCIPWRLPLRL